MSNCFIRGHFWAFFRPSEHKRFKLAISENLSFHFIFGPFWAYYRNLFAFISDNWFRIYDTEIAGKLDGMRDSGYRIRDRYTFVCMATPHFKNFL